MKERQHIIEKYRNTRRHFEVLCKPLEVEDYSVQPADFVSPPKWHLAHTTWFYEQFVLIPFYPDYKIFNDHFAYLFNSYYNNAGQRVHRPNRGLMTRPSVKSVYDYRAYVDRELTSYMESEAREEVWERIDLGINHEEQHQELFLYDIKYILGHQPDFPIYNTQFDGIQQIQNETPLSIEGGLYEVGYNGKNFCYDNEQSRHKVYLNDYRIHGNLVTNGDFLDFINDSGYTNFNLWHAEGWDFIKQNQINAPMYWHLIEGQWHNYELTGLETIDLSKPVSHLSYFEAFAFAEWAGKRLPTEFEWEVAADQLNWGALWEWTESSYLPYPKFQKADGALGEYNGKFMVNQKVLRGASYGTALGHSRKTYRNFFHPHMRWHFCGLRLAEKNMNQRFAKDIKEGLKAPNKHLSSRYFYDDIGSKIFQEIMAMEEYYLTNSELEILQNQSDQIYEKLNFFGPFNIIELGAGDGQKTRHLLEYLYKNKIKFNYIPIDISNKAIEILVEDLLEKMPEMMIEPKVGDYFEILQYNPQAQWPSLLLFLGSNIGNYDQKDSIDLLKIFQKNMKTGDKLLIGMDLKKNPNVIHKAYYDPKGVTRRFNLNLLNRINREFNGEFDVNNFDFYCHYNPCNGEVRSYIVSKIDQTVPIVDINLEVKLKKNELIWTELSRKYDFQEIEWLSRQCGFEVIENFTDLKTYFVDTLWEK